MRNLTQLELTELEETVASFVYALQRRFNPHRMVPMEDLCWDCFTTLYQRRFFDKYDHTKSKKSTYIFNGVKNYLIDQERKAEGRPKSVSLDVEIGDGITFADRLDDKSSEEAISVEAYLEAIKVLKPEDSGIFSTARTQKKYKGMELSAYSVVYLSLEGYKNHEIASFYDTSSMNISHLYDEAVKYLRSKVQVSTDDGISFEAEENKCKPCPICGYRHTVEYEDRNTSGLLWYRCSGCKEYFTRLTGTPLNNMPNKARLRFVEFCERYYSGDAIKTILSEMELYDYTVEGWLQKLDLYFADRPNDIILRYVQDWKETVLDAIESKEIVCEDA